MGVKRVFFETPWLREKSGVQTRRVGLWVCSSAWCEKGVMRRLCNNALWRNKGKSLSALFLVSQTPGLKMHRN